MTASTTTFTSTYVEDGLRALFISEMDILEHLLDIAELLPRDAVPMALRAALDEAVERGLAASETIMLLHVFGRRLEAEAVLAGHLPASAAVGPQEAAE